MKNMMLNKKNISPLESEEQERFFEWVESNCNKYTELNLCFASMAGIRLTPGLAKKAKKQGNRAGVPDIIFPVPKKGYHGLFIELKRRRGYKVSVIQKEWIETLNGLGYCADVCYGSDDAILLMKKYIGIDLY